MGRMNSHHFKMMDEKGNITICERWCNHLDLLTPWKNFIQYFIIVYKQMFSTGFSLLIFKKEKENIFLCHLIISIICIVTMPLNKPQCLVCLLFFSIHYPLEIIWLFSKSKIRIFTHQENSNLYIEIDWLQQNHSNLIALTELNYRCLALFGEQVALL